jgi:hypothetical protein
MLSLEITRSSRYIIAKYFALKISAKQEGVGIYGRSAKLRSNHRWLVVQSAEICRWNACKMNSGWLTALEDLRKYHRRCSRLSGKRRTNRRDNLVGRRQCPGWQGGRFLWPVERPRHERAHADTASGPARRKDRVEGTIGA